MTEKLYTRTDVARYLGISRMTLYRYEKLLALPATPGATHIWMIDATRIDDWYNELVRQHPYIEYACYKTLRSRNVTSSRQRQHD
jgi:DNA-binding XRE family transcriptional regulator